MQVKYKGKAELAGQVKYKGWPEGFKPNMMVGQSLQVKYNGRSNTKVGCRSQPEVVFFYSSAH